VTSLRKVGPGLAVAAVEAIASTALSTLAMIIYPIVAAVFELDDAGAGVFLGGTIHDVALVVGAGYSVSQQTGDTATIVKLLGVGMLLPVCLAIGVVLHLRSSETAQLAPLLPWLAVAFAALVAIGSMAWNPSAVVGAGSELSRWYLVTAIAAIGIKVSLKSLMVMGWRPVMLVVAESLVIAVPVMGAVMATGADGRTAGRRAQRRAAVERDTG
jgi:uncharacterized membrane protein YadS